MRAIICSEIGSDFEKGISKIREVRMEIPEPKGTQVQIRVSVVSVNFLETLMIQGRYQMKVEPPFILGNECSGVVTKVGPRVRNFRVGDRVTGFTTTGAQCEYALGEEKFLWQVPEGMSMEDAASFPCTYGTAYMTLVQRAKLRPEHTLLVTAASGGVGTACVQIAAALGCRKIIGCVGSEPKTEIARACGCHQVVNYRQDRKWGKSLKKQKAKLDVVVDMVGGEAIDQSLKCMNWYGKLMIVGFASGKIPKIRANRVLLKSIDISGIAWGATAAVDYQAYYSSVTDALELYSTGKLKPVIGNVYTLNLSGAVDAYRDLAYRKSVGKLLLKFDTQSKL